MCVLVCVCDGGSARYADAVIDAYRSWKLRHAPSMDALLDNSSECDYGAAEEDAWPDAELDESAAMLSGAASPSFH